MAARPSRYEVRVCDTFLSVFGVAFQKKKWMSKVRTILFFSSIRARGRDPAGIKAFGDLDQLDHSITQMGNARKLKAIGFAHQCTCADQQARAPIHLWR